MELIERITEINFANWIITAFLIISIIIAIFEIIKKVTEIVSEVIGKPVKWVKSKNKDHQLLLETSQKLSDLKEKHEESVRQSIRHDEMIKNDLLSLTNTVNGIADTLSEMKAKENETKLKELKDSLIRYYNKYKNIGEWSKLEKDAFWDLFEDYENRGGDGYIHSIVEPVMRELREID